MKTSRLSPQTGPRLFAAFGGLSLLAALGLAASRPVHSAGGPIPVSITNTPLLTTAADDHDKQGVQFAVSIPENDGGLGFNDTYIVPAGKRLVIDAISAIPHSLGDSNHYSVLCTTRGGLTKGVVTNSFNVLPDGTPFSTGKISPHQYADAGNQVVLNVHRTETGFSNVLDVTVTGHLVDIP